MGTIAVSQKPKIVIKIIELITRRPQTNAIWSLINKIVDKQIKHYCIYFLTVFAFMLFIYFPPSEYKAL